MFNLHYEFNKNIPVIRCTMCGKCHDAIEAVSYVDKNRGCCWYFPKYNLFEIKNLIDNKNIDFFYNILKMKNCSISQFHVEIKGLFKVKEYARYEKKLLWMMALIKGYSSDCALSSEKMDVRLIIH